MAAYDVVIAGAGPAGAWAGLRLARRGVRVAIVERSPFPRTKLCGDTLNPGAVAVLSRQVDPLAIPQSRPIPGMRLTGPGGVAVEGRYHPARTGLGVTREVFDHWLLQQAVAAGARVVHGTVVGPLRTSAVEPVRGLLVRRPSGGLVEYEARVTIGADGRRSRVALQCGLSRYATRPRRWAIGAYYSGVDGLDALGEMHIRDGYYVGIAATPDGRVNTCLVQPRAAGETWPPPADLLQARLEADLLLAPRFHRARRVSRPQVLGPMATVTPAPGCAGLLLAGDAAGFIDPMTGDGIRLALDGAGLAAEVAGEMLDGATRIDSGHERLAALARRRLGAKRRFNRALRRTVGSPLAVGAAARLAAICPSAFGMLIRYAGDCGCAE